LNCGTGATSRTGGKDWTGGRNGKAEKAEKAGKAGNIGAIVGLVRQGENFEF